MKNTSMNPIVKKLWIEKIESFIKTGHLKKINEDTFEKAPKCYTKTKKDLYFCSLTVFINNICKKDENLLELKKNNIIRITKADLKKQRKKTGVYVIFEKEKKIIPIYDTHNLALFWSKALSINILFWIL